MIRIMNEFWQLQMGKKSLMDYRISHQQTESVIIAAMINVHLDLRTRLLKSINTMMSMMRGQLSNWISTEQSNAVEQ